MSVMDAIDEALLGADDDLELDYDLEQDEEDALLADDNYEESYDETQGDVNQDHQYEEPLHNEEENDILDIDSNINLDETEEDFGDQTVKEENTNNAQANVQQDNDDEDEVEEQKERNRFLNERNNTTIQRTNSHEIPDTLDKVAVQPVLQPYNNQRNGRFQRGNRGRGRGRQNQYRGSVFARVGNIPPQLEGKTVLINPHFRGNVQVTENARLVWDFQNPNFPQHQQRYQGPQMAQVAPFQSQPSPWINPPYTEQNNNFNHPPIQPNYHEPPPQIQYNQHQPPEILNSGIRPLMQVNNHNQPPPFVTQPQQPPPQQQMTNWCDDQSYCENMYPPQANFRSRDIRFNNQQAIPSLLMNNPSPNFNQQPQQSNFQGRSTFNFPENQNIPNQTRPFINQNMQNPPPAIIQVPPNYPPQPQTFEQPPQHFIQQNQFNQNRHVQAEYDQYNDHNQFSHQSSHNQYPSPMHSNQNFQGQNFQQPVNYESNFIPNQPAPESFPPKQYNHQYQNRQNSQHQRQQINTYNNRSPPKRRSFENTVGSDRDLPKKKKRSMELSNLHEVPTVDMPDTTTEEKEEEDEETKAYRLKIEEQKKLREKILREKEERRKLAAAQKESSDNSSAPPLLTTLKTRTVVPTTSQPQLQKPIVKQPQQQIQTIKQPNQQWRHPQQQQQQVQNPLNRIQQQQQQPGQNPINRNPQQQQQQQQPQRQRQMMQQRKQVQINQQRPQNIQVQAAGQRTNQGRLMQQRRIQQQNQANIVITQKNEQTLQQQQQRIVMLKQNPNVGKTVANRRVVLKGMNTINETSISEPSSQESSNSNLSSFLSNRKVISNSAAQTTGVELNQAALLDTPIVVVSNLAAGTTDVKIRKLCQGLGPIQNIQMIPNARQATIRFKNIVSAHKFFKKYQRKIIDLSMIQVSLEPESKT